MRGDDVRSLLEEATSNLPPSAVNASLAVRTARRRRRVRRRLLCLSAVAVPVLTVVLLRTSVPSFPVRWASTAAPMSGLPVGDLDGTVPATTEPADDDPQNDLLATGFDPLRRILRVGWVPDTVVVERWELGTDSQEYTGLESNDGGFALSAGNRSLDRRDAVDEDRTGPAGTNQAGTNPTGTNPVGTNPVGTDPAASVGADGLAEAEKVADPPVGVVVTVLAPGRHFPLSDPVLGITSWTTHTAPAVQGHPALCVAERGDGQSCPVLRWQPEPDVWVSVGYVTDRRLTRSEVAMVTRRVAESVSLDAPESLRLPFWISGHTATLVPRSAVVREPRVGAEQGDSSCWSAGLVLDDGVPPDDASSPGGTVVIQVSDAGIGASGLPQGDLSTTVVAGQEVGLDADQGFLAAPVGGAMVVVRAPTGQADAVFGDLRVVESPARTKLWTDVPLA